MEKEIETLADFEEAVNRHDLTHSYSDDGSVWRRGAADLSRIEKAAARFPREDVERVWNAAVDAKLKEGYREQFYWRWPKAPQTPTGEGK